MDLICLIVDVTVSSHLNGSAHFNTVYHARGTFACLAHTDSLKGLSSLHLQPLKAYQGFSSTVHSG